MYDPRLIDAFWANVDTRSSTCWPWLGPQYNTGYGCLHFKGADYSATHLAHELQIGPVPDGMQINHLCDYRPCVRGSHIYAGTQLQNMAEMLARGRREKNAKLNPVAIELIRQLKKTGRWTNQELAGFFHVTRPTISYIVSGKTWQTP